MTDGKRKRGSGPFQCPYSGCLKVFSRSDHLNRHRANHSTQKLRCEWPGCGRLFARLDVKRKHENRHVTRQNNFVSERYDSSSNNRSVKEATHLQAEIQVNMLGDESSDANFEDLETSSEKLANKEVERVLIEKESRTVEDDAVPISEELQTKMRTTHHYPSAFTPTQTIRKTQGENTALENTASDKNSKNINLDPFLPIQWLLNEPINVSPISGRFSNQPENGAFHASFDDPLGTSTLAMLEEIFALTPEFPAADSQTKLDEGLLLKMTQYIPELERHPDFNISSLEWFLEVYWLLYHRQYPILHKPSFSTHEAQPLLLLSIITIGAAFAKKTTTNQNVRLVDPDGLADLIADPLRWLIFASEQAKPPCKAWVIQSLVILETFEITSTSRYLHERACIYNGAKIQLLRRSPILGGDPFKSVGSDVSRSKDLWGTWIESESMKRVALMSFYIDSVHAIVYGHPLNFFASQIKLSLPCPDDLWEYNDFDRHKAPLSVAQTPLFCDGLQKLLCKETVEVGPFGRQILLAGLINLLLQIEQNISQWSNFGRSSIQESWRETISSAINFWKTELPLGDCCLTSSSIFPCDADSQSHSLLPPFLRAEDTRCSCPVYHAVQIYMRIAHYDYIVYAGAPKRMNVPILEEDYEVVVKRIGRWAASPAGPLCVIESIILLCEILLSPEDSPEALSYFYEPDKDPFIYRPNAVMSATLSLWAYAFYSLGPESSFGATTYQLQINEGYAPAMEDASTYLSRIRHQFKIATGKSFADLKCMNANDHVVAIKEYYVEFPKIDNLHYLVGLLTSLRKGYAKCRWHVGREYSRLLDNCIKRSLGSKTVFCSDMYNVID
ncbi:LAMI_0G17788g1_1 [Lachancea mirantina]|uniref:LAMI_0G17788g1_1 n=1 Tax=Lachancea mirantina TaxID=1230905 RepID=A0A1G4KD63_9SACH|nr:LAMI_0G17788g1_1 [Lachancea mirantina]